MLIIKSIAELHTYYNSNTTSSTKIGFVPTMGALHQGHISLVEASTQENDITICSIFINPTQFNDKNDYLKYPVTIEKDTQLLEQSSCTILFLPTVAEMYPNGMEHAKKYAIGYLDSVLDGKMRPGHFQGVCAIVHKLLEVVQPHNLYMGQKDFQQCLVVKQLIQQEHLPVILHTKATLREQDGLAMSSRNARLSIEARHKATTIYTCLQYILSNYKTKTIEEMQQYCTALLSTNSFTPEYVLFANADTLELLHTLDETKKMQVLIAAQIDGVRLIDNIALNY